MSNCATEFTICEFRVPFDIRNRVSAPISEIAIFGQPLNSRFEFHPHHHLTPTPPPPPKTPPPEPLRCPPNGCRPTPPPVPSPTSHEHECRVTNPIEARPK